MSIDLRLRRLEGQARAVATLSAAELQALVANLELAPADSKSAAWVRGLAVAELARRGA